MISIARVAEESTEIFNSHVCRYEYVSVWSSPQCTNSTPFGTGVAGCAVAVMRTVCPPCSRCSASQPAKGTPPPAIRILPPMPSTSSSSSTRLQCERGTAVRIAIVARGGVRRRGSGIGHQLLFIVSSMPYTCILIVYACMVLYLVDLLLVVCYSTPQAILLS